MADDAPISPGPFDVATVKALVTLMSRFDLNEIDLRQGEARIRLSRGGVLVPGPQLIAPVPVVGSATPAPAKPISPEKPAASSKPLIDIKSPTLGTFYSKPSPDAQPFVKVGGKVTSTTVVCLIEAMKLFNEITADCAGTIAEILVENQQAVEFGQVLFRVDPTA